MTRAVYLDSSAIVKLVALEEETAALRAALVGWPRRISSELAVVEVARAARRRSRDLDAKVRHVLAGLTLVALDRDVLDAAAEVPGEEVRALDAIHVATAAGLGSAVGVVMTYDRRMAQLAQAVGLDVAAPR